MKTQAIGDDYGAEVLDESEARAIREILRALRSMAFGSVEITIHDSRIVQVERREKIRFDRSH